MESKTIGYILSGVGLLFIVLSSTKGQEFVPLPISGKIILAIGAVCVLAGIFLMSDFSKKKQAKEVPIYEGKGKKRTVVAYQREKK
tara:strand:- start:148 stop:405 length:258 start_codon:yes stop_codon:yes gene_type:complete